MGNASKAAWAIDGLILLGSIIFSCLFLLSGQSEGHEAAALLPNIVSVSCILLSLAIVVMKVQAWRAERAHAPAAVGEAGAPPLMAWWRSFAAMALYLLGILLVGIVWATFLYTLVLPPCMGYRKRKVAVLTSVIVTGGMYVAFSVVLKIRLPAGILF